MKDIQLLDKNWFAIKQSVCGFSHEKSGLPNQDAVNYKQINTKHGSVFVFAVADGHGSKKYFRSDEGARQAVEIAINTLINFIEQVDPKINANHLKSNLEEKVPQKIERDWKDIVEKHFRENALTEIEKKLFSEDELLELDKNPVIAYGSTLISVLMTDDFIAYFQLGDGDIMIYDEFNGWSQALADSNELIANETHSLSENNFSYKNNKNYCGSDTPILTAWMNFRVSIKSREYLPELIIISTDGLLNSFDPENRMRVGPAILNKIQEKGIRDYEDQYLKKWLAEVSEKGSGDDITIGIIGQNSILEVKPDAAKKEAVESKDRISKFWCLLKKLRSIFGRNSNSETNDGKGAI